MENPFKKRKGAWRCDATNSDGTRTCRRVEIDDNGQMFATGTEITVGTDEHCNPVFTGDVQTLVDDEEKSIENIAGKVTSQCKRERGL